MSIYIGEILSNFDIEDFVESEKFIKHAIEADERNDMMWSAGQNYARYAELFNRKGNLSKAKENLTKIFAGNSMPLRQK